MVDEVNRGEVGVTEPRGRLERDQHAQRHNVPTVGHDHRGVPGPARADFALRRHLDDGVVVATEVAQRRDVLAGAVPEPGLDPEPSGLPRFGEGELGGRDVEGGHVAAARLAPGPVRDPGAEQAVGPGAAAETDEPAVRHLAGGLEQEQAAVRIDAVDAAAFHFAGQGEVILLGVVAEEAEPEAALALERAVAGAGIAARAAEYAHHVPFKIDLVYGLAAGQRNLSGLRGNPSHHEQRRGKQCESHARLERPAYAAEAGDAGSVHSSILRIDFPRRSAGGNSGRLGQAGGEVAVVRQPAGSYRAARRRIHSTTANLESIA